MDNKQFWEDRYASAPKIWSGKVNQPLIDFVKDLKPGNALDLGCGEGADSLWLAKNGWHVTAVDISQNAVDKVNKNAESLGLTGSIKAIAIDLSSNFPTGNYDLVIAMYFHSPKAFDRTKVLKKALSSVTPGGIMFIVEHADTPPWSKHKHAFSDFKSAEESLELLNANNDKWQTIFVGKKLRETTSPSGDIVEIYDNIIALKKL